MYCNVVEILQCDISVGNILLTDEGKGILIDWELAKRTDKVGSRQFGRVVSRSIQPNHRALITTLLGNLVLLVCKYDYES